MKINNTQRGFTMLEMIVSLGIFTVVAVIAVGTLVKIVGLNRQAQTLQSSMNNLSFALESLSREIRMGTSFYCSSDLDVDVSSFSPRGCSGSNGRLLAFRSSKTAPDGGSSVCNLIYSYRVVQVSSDPLLFKLEKAKQSDCGDTLTYHSILDENNIFLTDGNFNVYKGAGGYSWADIRFRGYSGNRENELNYFNVQTSVSQRMAD
ncbi:MAG: type II secretion system protein [Candidatus Paceibacterota bacterium]|jgi:prepilin-type N-terminal cleavage/methylation domain-containing protein